MFEHDYFIKNNRFFEGMDIIREYADAGRDGEPYEIETDIGTIRGVFREGSDDLVFHVPGFTAYGVDFDETAQRVSETYDVSSLWIDLPGQGMSTGTVNLENSAEAVSTIVNDFDDYDVFGVGHSLGSMALTKASAEGSDLEGIIAMSMPMNISDGFPLNKHVLTLANDRAFNAFLQSMDVVEGMRNESYKTRTGVLTKIDDDINRITDDSYMRLSSTTWKNTSRFLNGLMRDDSMVDYAGDVDVPILLINGSEDTMIDDEDVERFKEGVNHQLRYEEVEGNHIFDEYEPLYPFGLKRDEPINMEKKGLRDVYDGALESLLD